MRQSSHTRALVIAGALIAATPSCNTETDDRSPGGPGMDARAGEYDGSRASPDAGEGGLPRDDAGPNLDASDPDGSDAEAKAMRLNRNTDLTDVVVWSQNMGMFQFAWQNAVRCMVDSSCNQLGHLPDLIILQETTDAQARAMRDDLIRQSGVRGWGIYALDKAHPEVPWTNYRSKALVYNAERFTRTRAANDVRAWNVNRDNECTQARYQLVRFLRDDARAAAGYKEKGLLVASRHDDNFRGPNKITGRDTCDGPDAVNTFCSIHNSIDLTKEFNRVGAGLEIMAGDWNYKPKTCTTSAGTTTTNWKHAYGCTTKYSAGGRGIITSGCGSLGNLAWRDPRLEGEGRDVYDRRQPIDHVHIRDSRGFTLNGDSGVIGKHFYCGGVHPDADGDGKCDTMMSDHSPRVLRIEY